MGDLLENALMVPDRDGPRSNRNHSQLAPSAEPARTPPEDQHHGVVTTASIADWCTPATARPDGSAILAKASSQAIAAGEEQAIDLPPGTVPAHAAPGKNCSKMC